MKNKVVNERTFGGTGTDSNNHLQRFLVGWALPTILKSLSQEGFIGSAHPTICGLINQKWLYLCQWQDLEAEADEMWSFVGSNQQQQWLW